MEELKEKHLRNKQTVHGKNSKNLSVRTLFAPNEALSALAAPFLTPISCTVDGNVRGKNGCEDTFIRTRGTLIRAEDILSHTEPSIQILEHCHAFPSDALGETCGA